MRNAVDHKKHKEEHIKHRNIFVPLVVLLCFSCTSLKFQ